MGVLGLNGGFLVGFSVYRCLRLFTAVYVCLQLFTSVYSCLRLF